MTENCPCCLEPLVGKVIDPFTEENLMDMHLNGVFLSRWCVKWYNGKRIYILNIDENIDLPFKSLDDIRSQFNKPISFYEDYLNNFNVSESINGFYYKGQCGHNICFNCYNMITENKCPCCRMVRFLKPAPIKTFQIGHIQWEDNYNDEMYDDIDIDEALPIEDILRNDSDIHSDNINYFTIEACKNMIDNAINLYNNDRDNPDIARYLYNISAVLSGIDTHQ